MHPTTSRTVVHASEHVGSAVIDFNGHLGIERDRQSLEARRWADAAAEMKDKMLATGASGVDAAKQFGSETRDRAKSVTGKISSRIAERTLRQRAKGEDDSA